MKRGRKSARSAVEESGSHAEIPTENQEVAISVRDNPPSHYMLKVESFSMLSQIGKKTYETEVFEAGGYKWRLALHPNGDEQRDGDGHISLYLKIVETNTLPVGWMVDVDFKLFVYDHIRDKYYIYQDSNGKVRRFHAMRTEWGFPKLLRLEDFNNACNGFLFGDTCVFGAEVFVINYTGHGECVSTIKTAANKYTWKIDKFSQLNTDWVRSNRFTAAEHEWALVLHPRGNKVASGESISLYLELTDPPEGKIVNARFTLLIRDQVKGMHFSRTVTASLCNLKEGWGFHSFVSLKDLKDPLKGFLANDTIILEATVNYVSFRVKNRP